MNDEIKEILDKFDKVLENYELDKKWGQISVDSICHLFPSEIMVIKDCLTNLREENERLKKENDSLNSYYEYYKDLADKQNKLMIDYKSRCEKAINLIFKKIRDVALYGDQYFDLNELLQILQGVGKDE